MALGAEKDMCRAVAVVFSVWENIYIYIYIYPGVYVSGYKFARIKVPFDFF